MESEAVSNFESTRLNTLAILQKLEDPHKIGEESISSQTPESGWEDTNIAQLSQLSANLKKLVEMAERSAIEHRILESLRYKRMEARQETIADAHAKTFEWIFHPQIPLNEPAPHMSFLEWLIKGNDIFWITGKAGSGKSTLMKFVSHHRSSMLALQEWAGERELIVADFYFWYAGTDLQKSQEGLLQSLLHSILCQCPELMPLILPRRWEQSMPRPVTTDSWTRIELLKAFTELSSQSNLSKKFCFFIDGLDEYDGNHKEVIDLIQGFTQSRDIKICLSSRPWNVFEREFGCGSHPRLYVDDLTRQDIKTYVRDTLSDNRLFQQLKEGRDRIRCTRLEDEIVYRAQGVFLWVFLVVRSLLHGLTNADRITDLEKRLRLLPTDLEIYFRHMLESIDDFYKTQMVQTFQVALQAVEPLNLMTYAMIDEIEENPSYAIMLPTRQMATTEIESRCEDMKLRINARCKDLLQVTPKRKSKRSYQSHDTHKSVNAKICSNEDPSMPEMALMPESNNTSDFVLRRTSDERHLLQSIDSSSVAGSTPNLRFESLQDTHSYKLLSEQTASNPFFEYEVEFLHRTVKDFFQVKDIQDVISSRLPKDFDTYTLLCHAYLAQIKVAPLEAHDFYESGALSELVDDLVHYAHRREANTGLASTEVLDELSCAIHSRGTSLRIEDQLEQHTNPDPSMRMLCRSILGFAVQRDLRLYVSEKLDEHLQHGLSSWKLDELALGALQCTVTSKHALRESPNQPMLELLVSKGIDLNRCGDRQNVWDGFIGTSLRMWDYFSNGINEGKIHRLNAISAMLDVGAEPNWSPGLARLRWVEFILMPEANWRSGSIVYEAALTKTILAIFKRQIDPQWKYDGCTLWVLFMRSVYGAWRSSGYLSPNAKKCINMIVKKFLGHGAHLDDMIYEDMELSEPSEPSEIGEISIRMTRVTVTEALACIFTETEFEGLMSIQKAVGPSNSKVITSRARRKKEKKRRQRKKRYQT